MKPDNLTAEYHGRIITVYDGRGKIVQQLKVTPGHDLIPATEDNEELALIVRQVRA